jgi:hypothetical protein
MQEVEGVEDKSLEGRDIHSKHCTRRVLVVLLLLLSLLMMVVVTRVLLTIADIVINVTSVVV